MEKGFQLLSHDTLLDGAILCTVNVVGLCPHIPHNEGIEAVKEALLKSDSNVDNGEEKGRNHKCSGWF